MADETLTAQDASPSRPKVFMSYTRAEIEPAKRIIDLLEEAGFEVWWDGLLEGGDAYLPTTEAALESADCVVVLWSKTAVDSNWVRDEAQRGRERGCLVPLSLDGTMAPLGFRQIQLLDISAWDGSEDAPEAQRIVHAVRGQADVAGREWASSTAPEPQSISQTREATAPPPPGSGVSRRVLAIGALSVLGGAAAIGTWQSGLFAPASNDVISMAVLRFANLTGDDEQAWFSDGLSSEVRVALARNPFLKVSAPTSSVAQPDEDEFALARKLGVANFLRGSVQHVAETIRITVELIEADRGEVRWNDSFDRRYEDLLALQSDIAETVALNLVSTIAGQGEVARSIEAQRGVGGTDNATAYEAFLRGLAFSDLGSGESSDRAALKQFEAAIAADPGFAAAHALRSSMLAAVANYGSDPKAVADGYSQSIAAARRAIELAPDLASGHLALGYALNYGQLDRAAAYPHHKRAQELSPGDADVQRSVAVFYAYGNQQALATQMIDKVLELDPINARAFRTAGYIALFARDYSATISRMMEALKLNPELVSAEYAIGSARLMQGDVEGALKAFQSEPVPVFSQTGVAICQKKLGNEGAAQAALQALLKEYGGTGLYQQAQIYAQWGETPKALSLIERAFEEKDPGVLFATNDPLLDPIRGEPALDRLLLRLAS
ncbi:MAG: TIR domain-containing protein [Erythrobacter sp.]